MSRLVVEGNNVDYPHLVSRRSTESIALRLSYGGSERPIGEEFVVSVRLPGIPKSLSKSVSLSKVVIVVGL